jgi:hypothetical protein
MTDVMVSQCLLYEKDIPRVVLGQENVQQAHCVAAFLAPPPIAVTVPAQSRPQHGAEEIPLCRPT